MAKEFGGLSYANYTPQYVGQDIEGINQIAQKKNQDYDNNITKADAMSIAINNLYTQVRPEDAPTVKAAADKAINDLQSVKDSGDWENSQYKINKVAKDFALNNVIKGAVQKKSAYDTWLADLNNKVGKDEKEGGITTDQRDRAIMLSNANPDNNKPVEWDNEKLKYNNMFKGYTPVPYRDLGKEANDFMKDAKPSQEIINGKTVSGYISPITEKFVDKEQLQKEAIQFLQNNPKNMAYLDEQAMFHHSDNFKNPDGTYKPVTNTDLARVGYTQEALDKVAKETGVPSIDLTKLTPKEKFNKYYEAIKQHELYNATNPSAGKYSFVEDKANYLKNWMQQDLMKHKWKMEGSQVNGGALPQTYDTNKQDNLQIPDLIKGTPFEGLGKDDFTTTGDLKPKMKNTSEVIGLSGTSIKGSGINTIYHNGLDTETNNKRLLFIQNLQKDNPELQSLKPSQVFDAYVEARKNSQQLSQKEYSTYGLNTKKLTESVVNNLGGRDIHVEGKGNGTLSEALDLLGLSNVDDIKKALKEAKSNTILPVGGNYKFQIMDSKGNPKEVTISGSNEQKDAYAIPTKMAELENKGETGEGTFNHNGEEYGYKTQIVSTPKGKEFQTTGGKLFTEKQTKDFLNKVVQKYGEEGAKQYLANRTFIGNRITEDKNASELMLESHNQWLNSPYNIPFQEKETKNPIEFDENSNDENSND